MYMQQNGENFQMLFFPHFMIRVFRSECIFVTRRGFKARPRHLKPARSRASLSVVYSLPNWRPCASFEPPQPSARSGSPFGSWSFCDGPSLSPGHAPAERPVLTAPAPSVCPAPHSANGERNARWVRPDPTEKQSGLEQVCLFLSCPGWAGTGKLLP